MSKLRTRTVVILCIIIASVGGYAIYDQLMSSVSPYTSVSELVEAPEEYYNRPIQVMGVAEKGTAVWNGGHLTFTLKEGNSSIRVICSGNIPSGFQDGSQVVAVGKLDSNLNLQANQLLVKCPSKYESSL